MIGLLDTCILCALNFTSLKARHISIWHLFSGIMHFKIFYKLSYTTKCVRSIERSNSLHVKLFNLNLYMMISCTYYDRLDILFQQNLRARWMSLKSIVKNHNKLQSWVALNYIQKKIVEYSPRAAKYDLGTEATFRLLQQGTKGRLLLTLSYSCKIN